jgi:PAS domain S-box-containing protein
MAVVDDQRRLLFYNSAADAITKKVLGRGLELHLPVGDFLLDETRQTFNDAIDRALGGEEIDLTLEVPGLVEAADWREYRFRPVRDDGTRAVYVSAVDVAAEQRANQQFWTIFGAAPIPMLILDAQGSIREVNDVFCDQLGYRRDAIVSKPISTIVPEELREKVAREYRQFAAGEIGTSWDAQTPHSRWYSRERRYTRADGELRWADVARVAIRHFDESLDYVLVMLLDTTEYKNVQRDLENERVRTQAIFDAAVDGIVTVDKEGLIRQFNHAAEEIFGYPADEVVGKCATLLVPPTQRSQAGNHLERAELRRLARIVGGGGEFDAMRKDGTVFPVYLTVGEIHFDREATYVGVIRDLTHQKELEQRLRRSERMEALGQLAGGIAHDFNNVLTIVNSYTHACKVALEEGQDCADYLKKIRIAADRGARLTRQLLTFSPEQIGEPERLDINEVVRELEGLIRSVIQEDIELEVLTEDDVPPIVADPGQMEQVLMNLVVNARDAMPQGGELTIKTRRVVLGAQHPVVHASTSLEPGDFAVLQVEDTGHGIDEATLARIFEPFFTTKPEGKGTGLGLATVYGIVQRYHGAILVDSKPGEGAAFAIYLPATSVAEDVAPVEQEEPQQQPPLQASGTVLVVEDEADIREPLCMVLESEGFTVLEASSGDEALEIVGNHPGKIDLVLTDVVMPGLTGIDLAKSLREQYPSIQSVLVSGYSGEVLERKDIDAQQVRVTKPYDLDDLLGMVRELLGD